eukprot:gene16485-16664_t
MDSQPNPSAEAKQGEAERLARLGAMLYQIGSIEDAISTYEQVLALAPEHFDALQLLGVVAARKKNYVQALDFLSRAIAINPTHPQSYNNLGNALQDLNRLDEALVNYDQAISLKPDFAEAHNNRGNTLAHLKRWDEAIASFISATTCKPDYTDAYLNLGDSLVEIKLYDEALIIYAEAGRVEPGAFEAFFRHGNVLLLLKRWDDALASFAKVVEIKPDHLDVYINQGIALHQLKRLDDALISYEKILAINPGHAEAHNNRGGALLALKRVDEAINAFTSAIHCKPDFADAHVNLSLSHLLLGNFREGFLRYEWRWKKSGLPSFNEKRNYPQPLWLGDQSLQGKTILLYAEQGLGDTIQFCRYVDSVAKLGATIILEVQRPLAQLLSNLRGIRQVVASGDALPDFDYHCPLMSLPLAFKTELDTIPSVSPDIQSNPEKLRQWGLKLGNKNRSRIGLVWGGNSVNMNDHIRSVSLSLLLRQLPAGFDYISLQKDFSPDDLTLLDQEKKIICFGDDIHDFSDTAALCELMDVIISVDTSVAHLAASLNKPTWILLPYTPDWRWQLGRTDNPWYPSVKLYRQESLYDWDTVLTKVAVDLKTELKRL